jgi:hypothetical protein
MKLIPVAMFLLACLLMSYGSAMVFFVPGTPGHPFDRSRILFGVLPLFLSTALLVAVGVLREKSKGSDRFMKSIANSIALGVSSVVLLYVAMGLVADLRQK